MVVDQHEIYEEVEIEKVVVDVPKILATIIIVIDVLAYLA